MQGQKTDWKEQQQRRLETGLFIAGWAVVLLLAAAVAGLRYLGHSPLALFAPCPLYSRVGLYCPGCGGTRAVEALLRGKLLQSLYYHPLVLYCVVVGSLYLGSHTLRLLSGGRVRGLRYRIGYPLVALGLPIWNMALHNSLLLWLGIRM